MILTRRNFLLFAPAVVAAASLMPVRSFLIAPDDPLVHGIRYQSWKPGEPRYEHRSALYHDGHHILMDDSVKPLSYFIRLLDKDIVHWEPVLK
jgi:hypothetical protein